MVKALTAWNFTYQETDPSSKSKGNVLPDQERLVQVFESLDVRKGCFQPEIGKEGRKHYQGNVVFKKPISMGTLRKAIKSVCREHYASGCLTLQPCVSVSDSMIYCKKEETRIPGTTMWLYPSNTYLGQDLFSYDQYLPWQKNLSDKIVGVKPHERDIHLIVDPIGGSGKSTFAKGLSYNHGAEVIPLGLSSAQMKAAIVGEGEKDIYILDLPRNNKSYVEIFDTIEEIKRGFVLSCFHGKLKKLYMSRPHIVCFANEMPDLTLLSMDMWKVYSISSLTRDLEDEDKWAIRSFQIKNKSRKNNSYKGDNLPTFS